MFEQILVVGYGRIAEVLYMPYLKEKNYEIIVYENNKDRYALLEEKHPEVKIVKEIPFSAKGKKSAAINLTPVFVHEKINIELLEKGWNTFTEKIAADSSKGWKELIDISNRNSCTIVSAPVSANIEQENQMLADLKNGVLGDILEVHSQFIGGGPARRGWIAEQRKWMLQTEDAIRVDLAPYLLTPVIKTIGSVENIRWYSNRYYPKYNIGDSSEILESICGTSEIGIGYIGKAIATFLVSYRANVKDVVTKVEIVGTKDTKAYNLAESVSNGVHSYARVVLGLDLLSECCLDENKCKLHHQLVSNVIECVKK